ncbi:MAG: hypothetical protein MJ172_04900 [Clostridia bacterium]|nr:hypothetical protein [Clostridia bacterium]
MKSKKAMPFIGTIALTGCYLLTGCSNLSESLPSSFREASDTTKSEEEHEESKEETEVTTTKNEETSNSDFDVNIDEDLNTDEHDYDYYKEVAVDYDYDSGNPGLNNVIKVYLDKGWYVFTMADEYYAAEDNNGNNKFFCSLMPDVDEDLASYLLDEDLSSYGIDEPDLIETTDYGTKYTINLGASTGVTMIYEYYKEEQVLAVTYDATNSLAVG